uniref:Uncharacterized protein n=1 Tax=uncultured marine virus TaxID=186617 RepID=A0A0F7L5R5_9VIRU|nr:hypothetical protein [uncultured marine virus]
MFLRYVICLRFLTTTSLTAIITGVVTSFILKALSAFRAFLPYNIFVNCCEHFLCCWFWVLFFYSFV